LAVRQQNNQPTNAERLIIVGPQKDEGFNVLEKIDESEYGEFAWVIDPEGNKVELRQPPQGQ
jgi:hypothetical protein